MWGTIIAWASDGEIICPICAGRRWTQAQLDAGDVASPIFGSDECLDGLQCGDCREVIRERESESC